MRLVGEVSAPWADEDERLLVRTLWARANGRRLRDDEPDPGGSVYWDQARAVLAALSSAGRLVPPGSEVREEWRLRFSYPDGTTGQLSTGDEDEARSWVRGHRDCKHGTELLRLCVITTPWSPVPDTEEGSNHG